MTRIRSDLLKESQSQSFMCLNLLPYRLQTSSSDRPVSAHNVITLKVKSEDGNHTFILKMCFSETIGHLRQYLDKHRWDHTLLLWQSVFLSLQRRNNGCLYFLRYREGSLPGYDIISAYPQCSYDDDSQALQSCGLTSNVTLLLRKRKHPQTLTEVR